MIATSHRLALYLSDLWSETLRCVVGGFKWEPGETALINNATLVSEGATQSPHTTEPFLNESKEDSNTLVSGTPV